MLDYGKIKQDLEGSFQRDKSEGIDIDINVNVISEANGKFSISVHDKKCILSDEHLDTADITVGFVNKDIMIEIEMILRNLISRNSI